VVNAMISSVLRRSELGSVCSAMRSDPKRDLKRNYIGLELMSDWWGVGGVP
jgi:hypothetical protein